MRVATYNIKNDYQEQNDLDAWPKRLKRVLAMMAHLDADLIGLQEVTGAQFIDLRNHFKDRFGIIGQAREESATKEYNPILYDLTKFTLIDSDTFWLSETPWIMSKTPKWKAACYRIATWAKFETKDRQTILMINTHLDHESELARCQGIKVILDFVKTQKINAVLLTGDFNGNQSERYYQLVTESLTDSATVIKKDDPSMTFIGEFVAEKFQSEEFRYIDFIFVSKQVTVTDFAIDTSTIEGRLPSDHYPVVATIEEG